MLSVLYGEALSLLKHCTTSVWLLSSATSLAVFPSTFLAVLLAPLQGRGTLQSLLFSGLRKCLRDKVCCRYGETSTSVGRQTMLCDNHDSQDTGN